MSRLAYQIITGQHASIAAVLRSLSMMVDNGPGDEPERFFDVVRAMLFYIDEYPERHHHPKETKLLFPKLLRVAPQLAPIIERLDADHARGEDRVRELQHQLLAWELLGEERRPKFERSVREYIEFYLDHMRCEETELMAPTQELLTATDWAELDAAFQEDPDPLHTRAREPVFDRLFTRIVLTAPEPIGVGPALRSSR